MDITQMDSTQKSYLDQSNQNATQIHTGIISET